MHFQVTAIKLDGGSVVAEIHSDPYDTVMRYDREALNEWLANAQYHIIDINKYWLISKEVDDTTAKKDLTDYINSSPYLLSCLRDARRLKEIEAIIYAHSMVTLYPEAAENTKGTFLYPCDADHLHSLITQYGDGRVETELLKSK